MQVAESVRTRPRYPFLDRMLEASWLAAAALVPLAVAHEQWMIGFIQMAKIGVFRTIVIVMVSLVVLRWALEWRESTAGDLGAQMRAVRDHPARLLFLGAAAVLLATLVSLAFSPVKSIGIWGIDPGWDSYNLVALLSYLAVFGVIAVHLRTPDQVRRLLWTIVITAVIASFYGIGQHFGFDPFRTDAGPVRRASLSFGNPIFAGSFLVITIPLTIAAVLSLRFGAQQSTRSSAKAPRSASGRGEWAMAEAFGARVDGDWLRHVALGVALVAPQAAAMLFTLSRGPWVGLAVGLAALLVLLLVSARQHVAKTVAILGLSVAVAFGLSALPVPGGAGGAEDVVDRVGSIAPEVGAGMTHRWTNWTTAAEVFLTVPWADTEAFPEIPDLSLRPLRPLIGYGPDMYGYAYPLAGESTYTFELATHGHNFVVHHALELGLLGVAAYLFMAGAAALVMFRLFQVARRGEAPGWYLLLLVGLGSAFVGRAVEQIPGKAQVSDMMLSWMLAGLLVGLTVLRMSASDTAAETTPGPRRRSRSSRTGRPDVPQEPLSFPRVIGATALAMVLVVLWWQHVVAPVQAASAVPEGQRAAESGDTQRAVNLYQRAADAYPPLATPYFRVAQVVFQVAQNVSDEEQKADLLRYAYAQNNTVLERNPLDHRALQWAAEYHRELAIAGLVTREESLREALLLVELMPGFWQSYAALGWSLVRQGDVEQGLAALAEAKERDNGHRDTHLLYYMEAYALAELGHLPEAIAAAEESLTRHAFEPAEQLLTQLTEG